MSSVFLVCGGNEMGDEDKEYSTIVCATSELALEAQSELEEDYDWADIFEKTLVE